MLSGLHGPQDAVFRCFMDRIVGLPVGLIFAHALSQIVARLH